MADRQNRMNYELRPIDNDTGRKMIVKNHYTHAWSNISLVLGIFEIGNESSFFDTTDDKLIGCICYGEPVNSRGWKGISPLITDHSQVWELKRLWIADVTPKNTESQMLAKSFRWLEQNRPDKKVLVSYADPAHNHTGVIYQATGWWYCPSGQECGCNNFSFDNGKTWIHARTMMGRYGSQSPHIIAKKTNQPFICKKMGTRYRYLMPLGNKIWRKQLFKTLKYKPEPYPKEINQAMCPQEITRYE